MGRVHSFETFGLVAGPGVICVIFLAGCPMRCRYCHNPDTWDPKGGTEMTAEEIFKKAYRYKNYWKNNGGITVSGGEALLQMDFVTEIFRLAKAKSIHTALDTSGVLFAPDNADWMRRFDDLMAVTDLFILDLKEMDPQKHKALTGCDNAGILAMARYLGKHKKEMWIRHVLVPGLTDDEEGLRAIHDLIEETGSVSRAEILPYHTLGIFKWENLGIPYTLNDARVPTPEEVKRAEELI